MNVMQVAQQYGKKGEFVGLIYQDKEYTNTVLDADAKRFKTGLEQIGVRAGDIVATILPNCTEIFPIYAGIFMHGAVLLPIIYALTAEEMAYILNDSKANIIITT